MDGFYSTSLGQWDALEPDMWSQTDAFILSSLALRGRRITVTEAATSPSSPCFVVVGGSAAEDTGANLTGPISISDVGSTQLLHAVYSAIAITARRRLNAEIKSAFARQYRVAQILRFTVARSLPPLDVSAAAAFGDINRCQVMHEWKKTQLCEQGLSLKEAMDWVLLWRAMLEKSPATTWSTAAEKIGLTRERVERIAKRLIGDSTMRLNYLDNPMRAAPFDAMREFGCRSLTESDV